MKERLPENNRPINRIAKEAMKRAQYSPDPSLMYCLQAAYECIQRGIIETRYPQLSENLEALMYQWSPKNVIKFLQGEHDLVTDLPKGPLVGDVASAVLEQLHSRLSATLPGYPRPRHLPANFG